MSIIHNLINKRPLDISRLNSFVSKIDGAAYEDRGNGIFYYWIDGKSTRGLDITLEQGFIEVRNTVLSNRHDYDLTNKIVAEILSLTDGIIFDESEEQVSSLPVFDSNRITETEIRDCELIQTLSKEKNDIAVYGPIRRVHFGKRLHKQFMELNGEQLKNKMFDLILTVNYQIPNFECGNIMQVGNSEEDRKIMKLLTNETDCIIDKYDYILLNIPDKQPIMITNEILNSMLPSNWKLVDEFTIVAPITGESEWDKLLANAKKHDLFNDFFKK
jgi:hypothetical protein